MLHSFFLIRHESGWSPCKRRHFGQPAICLGRGTQSLTEICVYARTPGLVRGYDPGTQPHGGRNSDSHLSVDNITPYFSSDANTWTVQG